MPPGFSVFPTGWQGTHGARSGTAGLQLSVLPAAVKGTDEDGRENHLHCCKPLLQPRSPAQCPGSLCTDNPVISPLLSRCTSTPPRQPGKGFPPFMPFPTTQGYQEEQCLRADRFIHLPYLAKLIGFDRRAGALTTSLAWKRVEQCPSQMLAGEVYLKHILWLRRMY